MSTARRLRIAAVVLLIAWFFSARLQSVIPLWLPFLVYAGLELNFLVGGLRERGSAPLRADGSRRRATSTSSAARTGSSLCSSRSTVRTCGFRPAARPTRRSRSSSKRRASRCGKASRSSAGADSPGARAAAEPPARPAGGARGRRCASPSSSSSSFPTAAGAASTRPTATEPRRSFLPRPGEIAGHDASVHCDAEGSAVGIVQHADGLAQVGGTQAYLTPDICYRLYRLAFKDDDGAFSQTARAIAVLAHESWHLHGESDEGVTNCYAFQSGVALGERLGLSEGTAARMMRQQLADNATYAQSAREYLVPSECRNGGELDLAPGQHRFP